ncbi:universal stress protein [Mycobacterium sp.]|uniref:universal stress protein n=1 Tax=Mycobacterium sp. TaxID=1785 RepID=UPI002D19ED00|nr:universal stress protein [Mycobacterium sp.]HTY34606.1 universal stress protein [Mycobacterium sp.]
MSNANKHPGVVVGIERSDSAGATVRWAAREAILRDVALTIVPIEPLPAFGSAARVLATAPNVDELLQWREDEARRIFSDAMKSIEDDADGGNVPETEINTDLLYSAHVPTLVDMSVEAQIMVVGCRGQAAQDDRGPHRSVSTNLVHLAHCPVAVIHENDSGSLPSVQLPVLVGIDGSAGSQLATQIAFQEASWRRVELVALHACSDGDASTMPTVEWSALQSTARETLEAGLAGWHECYPDVKVRRIVVDNEPAHHLLNQSQSAQLVVVGSRGRGGHPGMLLGSVAAGVVKEVGIPVIVARYD